MSGVLWFDWDEGKRQVNRNRHGEPTKREFTSYVKEIDSPD